MVIIKEFNENNALIEPMAHDERREMWKHCVANSCDLIRGVTRTL